MPSRMYRRSVGSGVLIGLLLAILAVTPVAADTELGHDGQVGQHSLRDTHEMPGATCNYKGVDPSPGGYSYEGKLKSVAVRPPRVRAYSGTQLVGWRFLLQRTADDSSPGPWTTVYKSGVQTDYANTSQNASFSGKMTSVTVASSGFDDPPYHLYRVVVVMIWYDSHGQSGKAKHEVDHYHRHHGNWQLPFDPPDYTDTTYCTNWVAGDI